jgi:hypothetical protein
MDDIVTSAMEKYDDPDPPSDRSRPLLLDRRPHNFLTVRPVSTVILFHERSEGGSGSNERSDGGRRKMIRTAFLTVVIDAGAIS